MNIYRIYCYFIETIQGHDERTNCVMLVDAESIEDALILGFQPWNKRNVGRNFIVDSITLDKHVDFLVNVEY